MKCIRYIFILSFVFFLSTACSSDTPTSPGHDNEQVDTGKDNKPDGDEPGDEDGDGDESGDEDGDADEPGDEDADGDEPGDEDGDGDGDEPGDEDGDEGGNGDEESVEEFTLQVTASPKEGGRVTPEGFNEYEDGDEVELIAIATEGWKFVEWVGDFEGKDDRARITVDKDLGIKAIFEPLQYSLNVTINGNGSYILSPDQETYSFGDEITIDINPDDGWNFVHWSGDASSTELPLKLRVKGDINLTAVLDNNPFAGGNGTEAYPYEVATIEHLQELRNYTDGYFTQINDINAGDTRNWNGGNGFNPIGDSGFIFGGVFDGGGYQITDLYINSDKSDVGLFGNVEGATIKNTHLVRVDISGRSATGGLVGWAVRGTKIENSTVHGKINGNSAVGGLVGQIAVSSEVTSSSADVDVSGNDNVGGLAGVNWASIRHSSATGKVTASHPLGSGSAGGLVGSSTSLIEHSYADSEVTGQEGVGGITGDNSGIIRQSYSLGSVRGNSEVGGLTGVNANDGEVSYSYSAASVSASDDVGGFVGTNAGAIESSYWDKVVSGYNTGVGRGGSTGLIGLETSDMSGSAARSNMTAFDWSYVWQTSSSYPVLR